MTMDTERDVFSSEPAAGDHTPLSGRSVEALRQPPDRDLNGPGEETPMTVMVVEDDSVLLELYRTHIETWRPAVRLVTVTDGFGALVQIDEIKPDLLIADLMMQGMDGFQLIQKLKESEVYRTIRIIVVTILDPEEIDRRGGCPTM